MFRCSIISLASLDVPMSFKYFVNGAIFGKNIIYEKRLFYFQYRLFFPYVINKQTNKQTNAHC